MFDFLCVVLWLGVFLCVLFVWCVLLLGYVWVDWCIWEDGLVYVDFVVIILCEDFCFLVVEYWVVLVICKVLVDSEMLLLVYCKFVVNCLGMFLLELVENGWLWL